MITAKGLVCRKGAAQILKGIDITVGRGEVDAIIGPSGSGKSTFLRCLNGLEVFQGGEVRIGDLRIGPETRAARDAQLLEQVRRRVGFVFQQFHLFPHLSVRGNLIEAPMQVLGTRREAAETRAAAILDRVGLAGKIDARPADLSGGQQQRVAIARALMMEPQAILFDEPTSALDPVTAGGVLDLMAELAADGQTMIVVTHSIPFARKAATRVHVFADGIAVESGPPADVFGNPQHETTKSFLRHLA